MGRSPKEFDLAACVNFSSALGKWSRTDLSGFEPASALSGYALYL